MKCPFCSNPETRVIDSRETDNSDAIRRRRECFSCKKRFTTYERHEEVPLVVIKKSGERELFDRGKLLNGLLRACVKRHVALEKLQEIVSAIEAELRNQFRYEIPAKMIGEMALDHLRELDKVAYIRFASVYRDFENTSEFNRELQALQKSHESKKKPRKRSSGK